MSVRTRAALALCAAAFAAAVPRAARAQVAEVRAGMTRAEVEAVLGAPAGARAAGPHTFLFYRDQCGARCPSGDVVLLAADTVIDAVFRSPNRVYTERAAVAGAPRARRAPRPSPQRGAPPRARRSARDSTRRGTAPAAARPATAAPTPPERR